MTTSELLTEAWKTLEEENYSVAGNYERRIFAHSPYSLFAGLNRPSNLVQLSLDVTIAQASMVEDEEVRGFRLHRDASGAGQVRLRIELTDASYRDIFLVVSSDILDRLLESKDESQAASEKQALRGMEIVEIFNEASELN